MIQFDSRHLHHLPHRRTLRIVYGDFFCSVLRVKLGCAPPWTPTLGAATPRLLWLCRALLGREGFHVPQLSRLTGLSKGELRRYLL